MRCKFCEGEEVSALRRIKSPHADVFYTLYECGECRQRFFDFYENCHSRDLLQKLYDEQAKCNAKVYKVEFLPSLYWKGEIEKIKHIFGDGDIRSVLDIGCRTGDFLMHWPKKIRREGVEASDYSANIAEARGLTIHRDFVENVFFKEGFDVVTCYALLEHLEKPRTILDLLGKLVNPGGVLAILVPAFDTVKQRYIWKNPSLRWHMYSPPEHLNFFTEEWLVKYLEEKFELRYRCYTCGGMLTFFKPGTLLGRVEGRLTRLLDELTWFNQKPIYDHMYLYFKKK